MKTNITSWITLNEQAHAHTHTKEEWCSKWVEHIGCSCQRQASLSAVSLSIALTATGVRGGEPTVAHGVICDHLTPVAFHHDAVRMITFTKMAEMTQSTREWRMDCGYILRFPRAFTVPQSTLWRPFIQPVTHTHSYTNGKVDAGWVVFTSCWCCVVGLPQIVSGFLAGFKITQWWKIVFGHIVQFIFSAVTNADPHAGCFSKRTLTTYLVFLFYLTLLSFFFLLVPSHFFFFFFITDSFCIVGGCVIACAG